MPFTRLVLTTAATVVLLATPLAAQTTTRVNVGPGGAQALGGIAVHQASTSDDGRYTAYASELTGLVANDTNQATDIFVRDHLLGTTSRVSVATGGAEANAISEQPGISRNGRYVAFLSYATNLAPGTVFGPFQVYVHDRQTATTVLASVTFGGTPSASGVQFARPTVSDDGRYVAFVSTASDLVANDTNGSYDLFVRDLVGNTTTRISVDPNGAQTTSAFIALYAMSADGRYVLFQSNSPTLVAGDTNNAYDVFLRDRVAGQTTRVSVGVNGVELQNGGPASMSADARYVAFVTIGAAIPQDTNNGTSLYRLDRTNGALRLVDVSSSGVQATGGPRNPTISGDGSYVVYVSSSTNLDDFITDTNGQDDVFLADLTGVNVATSRVSYGTGATQLARGVDGYSANVSTTGRYIVYSTDSPDAVPGDTNYAADLFRYDRQTFTTVRFTVNANGTQAFWPLTVTQDPSISADGRFVAFYSEAGNLVTNDWDRAGDLFLYDAQSGQVQQVSVDGNGNPTGMLGGGSAMSANGRFLAFRDTSGVLRVSDRLANRSTVASVNTSAGNGQGNDPSMSAGGRYVVFSSTTTNLVAGDTNGRQDIFVRDMAAGVTTRVSVGTGSVQGDGVSSASAISGDGRYVAFTSAATNLVAGDTNAVNDIFVYDMLTATTTRVSVATGGGQSNGASAYATISFDGRYVAFESLASNLVPGDTSVSDVFIHDRQTGTTTKISNGVGGALANSTAFGASISANGRYVAFESYASNLVNGDTNGYRDVFVFDRTAGQMRRASVATGGAEGTAAPTNLVSRQVAISANGLHVAFVSELLNLVPNDTNGIMDAFRQTYSGTPDNPALTPTFLSTYGLTGANADPFADPDGDGLTNYEEQQAGTHPNGLVTKYLAEGSTGFFTDRVALLNPENAARTVLLRFLRDGGQAPVTQVVPLPALTRTTIDVGTLAGMASAAFSTVMEADGTVVMDRTMSWGDASGVYGATAETGIPTPSRQWYLAEGSTFGTFDLFYLLQNPHPTQASTVTVRYLLPAPAAPITKTYTVAANSRQTIWVDLEDPALANTDVSGDLLVTAGPAIVVERAMYSGDADPNTPRPRLYEAGHNSAGVTAPALDWFLAEGAADNLFDFFVLLANPNAQSATVTLTYLRDQGRPPLSKTYTVPANSRRTIWVDFEEVPAGSGQYPLTGSISVVAHVTNNVPIIVERAMWFPGGPSTWNEAHNSPGATTTGTKWALADGEVGGPSNTDTYILIANTSAFVGSARVTLVFDNGTTAIGVVNLPANGRVTVAPGYDPLFAAIFPASGRGTVKRFGAIVESLGGTPAQIVVERAMYGTAPEFFGAGTNSLGTKLQ